MTNLQQNSKRTSRTSKKINRKVRVNLDKEKAETEAQEYAQKYDEYSGLLEEVRSERTDLLKGSNLPLEGLSVEDGELTYKGFKWDNLSGADQMKVGVAIVRKLNPKCGLCFWISWSRWIWIR